MIFRATAVVGVVALSASCSMPKPPAELEPQIPPPLAAPPPLDPALAGPHKLEDIGPIACRLETHGSVDDTADVRIAKSDPAGGGEAAHFSVRYDSQTLTFPVGDSEQVLASFETYGSRLIGFVVRNRLSLGLRSSHKLVLGMVSLIELPHAVIRADAGALQVRVPILDRITLLDTGLKESIPCEDLAASPFDVLPHSEGHEVWLDTKAPIGLSATADGPPELTVAADPQAGTSVATRLDAHDKWLRVEIATNEAVVTGWVLKSLTHPPSKSKPSGSSDLLRKQVVLPPPKATGLECKAPIDLAAPDRVGAGASLVWIGEVHPGTVLIPDEGNTPVPDPSWRSIKLRGVTSNVPILVKAESLDTCAKRL